MTDCATLRDRACASLAASAAGGSYMTLFTAEGLLDAMRCGVADMSGIISKVSETYLRHYTADPSLITDKASSDALGAMSRGNPVDNSSKGCGGIMRVAPAGIYGAAMRLDAVTTARLGGRIAFVTHHHPVSTVTSAICAAIVREALLTAPARPDAGWMLDTARRAARNAAEAFPGAAAANENMARAIDCAAAAAASSDTDCGVVASLGGGSTADEAFAIALSSLLRHPDNLQAALAMSACDTGMSPATSVAGYLSGAVNGCLQLPPAPAAQLELRELLLKTASHLAEPCHKV